MKLNGTQGSYHSVPQNVHSEEVEEPKKIPSQESILENGQNIKTLPSLSKDQPVDIIPEEEKKPMSKLRKICFVLSLLQCVLFIVAFGWLIPCKIPRYTDSSQLSHNWEFHMYGNDIITNLALSNNSYKPMAVVFGFVALNNNSVFGIRAVHALHGSELWEQHVDSQPVNIVCDGVDVNRDNAPDCIVTDNTGKMYAIDIKNGHVLWYMHNHHENVALHLKSELVSVPVVGGVCRSSPLPFIYAAVKNQVGGFFFVTVSGENGQIQEIYNMSECISMPENIMMRNVIAKDEEVNEFEEEDSPIELVMSCANREGHGIVYTTRLNELCGNSTFRSFNTISFKLTITESDEYPMFIRTISTNEGDDLVAATQNGKIKIFTEETQDQTEYSENKPLGLRSFTLGRFSNNSLSHIALVSNSNNSVKLLLLDSTTGHVLWNIPVENGTVASMYTIPHAFNNVDGILLKVVSLVTEDKIDDVNITVPATDVIHYQENYVLLECSEHGTFKSIATNFVAVNCPKEECHRQVFSDDPTAIVSDVDNDGIEELIFYTRSAIPSNTKQSVSIKLVRLNDFVSPKSCSSLCHC